MIFIFLAFIMIIFINLYVIFDKEEKEEHKEAIFYLLMFLVWLSLLVLFATEFFNHFHVE